ncbi:MAG TPA: cell division protein ZapA, partial [Candidatus Megaira endosymbiont of Hartmannula sinica]|nr:cell division protein ZapA [Candidatus Megaera endosymbiont of Hartmannula sinica]
MSLTNIKIRISDRSFNLLCSGEDKKDLSILGEGLDIEFEKIKSSNPKNTSFDMLMLMTALKLKSDILKINNSSNHSEEVS